MRDNHIITMLEEEPATRLSEAERAVIEAHVADCPECLLAYEAAQLSNHLIRARAADAVDVSPFFKTRVMASIKERRLAPEPSTLLRMWRAAGGLVSMMVGLVVILIGLTVFSYGPGPQMQSAEVAAAQNIYSPEYVVLEEGDTASDAMPYDQVLGTIYGSEDDDAN